MLRNMNEFKKVYIKCGYTNLRFGIDGLAKLVQFQFGMDPFEDGTLFLFCGRRSDRIKGLVWEGDGYLLLYKRIENGHFQWPRNSQEVEQMTSQEFHKLMEGFRVIEKSSIRPCTSTTVS